MIVFKTVTAALMLMIVWTLYWWTQTRNPYKLEMVIAKKGGGKTTDIQKRTFDGLAHGWNVYSTARVAGARYFDAKHMGLFDLPPESLVLIDEAGIIWHNRDFKNFKGDLKDFFKLQRHYKLKIVLYSQSWDVDKVLRELCDNIWIMKNYFGCYSISRRVIRSITVVSAKEMRGEGYIADDLHYDSLLFFWCGSVRFTFIPKYIPYFDSFEVPTRESMEYQEIPIPDIAWYKTPKEVRKIKRKEIKKSA